MAWSLFISRKRRKNRPQTMQQMISTQNLTHTYPGGRQISFKNWTVLQGENWLLLGSSGSGKSTLLHLLTGLLAPTTGEVLIRKTAIGRLKARELDRFRALNIGIIFQRPHLIKSLTVNENLLIAQRFAGLPENQQRISNVLESLDIAAQQHQYPSRLSQGQQQRVAIARAVMNEPALLFADEPTSSLDDQNASLVIDLLKTQTALHQATLVIATHDQRIKQAFTHTYNL